jgi:predicted dehydrogenase
MAATQEKVRVGVIGTGQIGKSHLKNYSNIAEVEIVAVSDINEQEAQRVAGEYSIPEVYTDFRELLKAR